MTDASPPAAVSLRQVEKYYGPYHALRTIDLEVAPRERVVVCGPSGSGKSTLIRCMNMLEVPDSGAVLIEGTKVTDASRDAAAALRSVGMVFQQFNLFPHKTVLENCTLAPVLVSGVALPEAEAKATSVDIDITPFEIDNLTASATRKCDLPNDIDRRAELLDLRSGLEHAAKNSILAVVETPRTDIVFGTLDAMRGIAVDDAEIDRIGQYSANQP